jgi:rhodanese-related sulfurtransferase
VKQPKDLPTTDVLEASRRLGAPDPPLLVDVREPNEYATVRAASAVLVPLSTFLLNFERLPKDRPLLMICAVGGRSGAATGHLLASGWTDVTNVAGGTVAWERAGLPVRRGAPAPGEGDLPAG